MSKDETQNNLCITDETKMIRGYYWIECNNCSFLHLWDGFKWDDRELTDEPMLLKFTKQYPIKVKDLFKAF